MRRGKKLTSQEVQEYLKWLNSKNSALTQELKQTQLELEEVKQENLSLKSDHKTKEALFEEDKRFLIEEMRSLKRKINEKYVDMEKSKEEISMLKRECHDKDVLLKEEIEFKAALKEEIHELQQQVGALNRNLEDSKRETAHNQSGRVLSNVLIKEVDSLRDVLDMKHNEIKSMQTALEEANQNKIALELSMRKIRALRAKCEDMEEQLNRRTESEQDLETEIYVLKKSILEEKNQNRVLSYQNEELKWKLNQKNDARSDRARSSQLAPPISPRVRKVIQKRKSVSYVLDLGESSRVDK